MTLQEIISMPVFLYGCETWSLTLREEHRLMVFENRVPRDEVTCDRKILLNDKLHNVVSVPDTGRMMKSMRIRWPGHVAHIGENRNALEILTEKHEGMTQVGRPWCRWEDNIEEDLKEMYEY
jgi:hypothetical protein